MNDFAAPRPRRWYIALILNAIFPPIGYAYVGAWKLVVATVVVLLGGSVAANFWTLSNPPGVYAFGQNGVLYGGLAIGLLLGVHAAILAPRAPPRSGRTGPLVLLYIAPWFLLFAGNLIYSAYGPHPTYVMSSGSMDPTLRQGDIVIVDGPRANCGTVSPEVGDVVVFRRPKTAEPLMHRIVAGPGQTVAMKDGLLIVDGQPLRREAKGSAPFPGSAARATELEETLPNGRRHRILDLGPGEALDDVPPTTVPAASWYVMGDNRDNAADSRTFGPVSAQDTCAVARRIVWAKDKTRVGREP
ncbi:MAG: signal peptidase I [Phenylobacterium zucineum]|nr:MAG: signal peptidase I [Phenylobacterium zucineum]